MIPPHASIARNVNRAAVPSPIGAPTPAPGGGWSPITSLDPSAPWWDKSIAVNAAQGALGPAVASATGTIATDAILAIVGVGLVLVGAYVMVAPNRQLVMEEPSK